jgi:hypothetical protein
MVGANHCSANTEHYIYFILLVCIYPLEGSVSDPHRFFADPDPDPT